MTNEEKILELLTKMDTRLSRVEIDLSGVKGQLDETIQIVKAVQHNQEFTNAKLEGIELTTAKSQALIIVDNIR